MAQPTTTANGVTPLTYGMLHRELTNTKLRMAKKATWTTAIIDQAVDEYFRFLCLKMTYPTQVIVPGKAVDEIWHDHILHTFAYTNFCNQFFGCYLHHDPQDLSSDTKLDPSDTYKLYEETFGRQPDMNFWGPSMPWKKSANGHASRCSSCR
jgi:hypothetical protein